MGGVHGLLTDVTKSGQEPESGLKTASFSGKTIYVIAPLHYITLKDTCGTAFLAKAATPSVKWGLARTRSPSA